MIHQLMVINNDYRSFKLIYASNILDYGIIYDEFCYHLYINLVIIGIQPGYSDLDYIFIVNSNVYYRSRCFHHW